MKFIILFKKICTMMTVCQKNDGEKKSFVINNNFPGFSNNIVPIGHLSSKTSSRDVREEDGYGR